MKSVLEVVRSTTEWFERRGVESPRLNAEHLLAHALSRRRLDLYLEFDRVLDESELAPMRVLVRRRGDGEPLQHLLGTAEFCGRVFGCDARALVPRPETEELVERVVADARANPAWKRVVDVGTGSGVIAITLALELPVITVEAVDNSPAALQLANANAARLECADRVRFLEGDLLGPIEGRVDLVVANLPYVATPELAGLAAEVRRDPRQALDGGEDGLDLVRRLAVEAAERVTSSGGIALEIGHGQGVAVRELLAASGWLGPCIVLDLQGRERFAFARHG